MLSSIDSRLRRLPPDRGGLAERGEPHRDALDRAAVEALPDVRVGERHEGEKIAGDSEGARRKLFYRKLSSW